ncbi:MAG TPA: SRPBCC family protein [Candidatus Limnocylindrales bacterium]|nr:SRPBCC family protein [Candidatus Limnocylindrales bacterium]
MAIGTPLRGMRSRDDGRRSVERRVWVKASPRGLWTTLHDEALLRRLFPELTLRADDRSWPAAGSVRSGDIHLGLLRTGVWVESLEARPDSAFGIAILAPEFEIRWSWRMEPLAGGTRVIHDGWFETRDRWAGVLVRLGRESIGQLADAHLRALKELAETTAEAAAGPAA